MFRFYHAKIENTYMWLDMLPRLSFEVFMGMKVMVNDKQSRYAFFMYFILYKIFQIEGSHKMRPKLSFCVDLKYITEYV